MYHFTGNLKEYTVLYPYDANLWDELTMRPGDVIHVEEQLGDWWRGRRNQSEDSGLLHKDLIVPKVKEEIARRRKPIGNLVEYNQRAYRVKETPGDELECVICHSLASNPHQTGCCGHTVCLECCNRWKTRQNSCPQCRNVPLKMNVDRRIERNIGGLTTYCIHYEEECDWKGSMNAIQAHLDRDCEYESIACPNRSKGCENMVLRKDLYKHTTETCLKRYVNCPFCKSSEIYQKMIDCHYKVCMKWPQRCRNHCGTKGWTRSTVQEHVDKYCLEQSLTCPFAEEGCNKKVKRKDISKHVQETHMDILSNYVKIKREHTALQASDEELEEKLKACEEKNDVLTTDHLSLKEKYDDLLAKNLMELEAEHERTSENHENLMRTHGKLKEDYKYLAAAKSDLEDMQKAQMAENKALKMKISMLEKNLMELEADHGKLKEDYKDLAVDKSDLKMKIFTLKHMGFIVSHVLLCLSLFLSYFSCYTHSLYILFPLIFFFYMLLV